MEKEIKLCGIGYAFRSLPDRLGVTVGFVEESDSGTFDIEIKGTKEKLFAMTLSEIESLAVTRARELMKE